MRNLIKTRLTLIFSDGGIAILFLQDIQSKHLTYTPVIETLNTTLTETVNWLDNQKVQTDYVCLALVQSVCAGKVLFSIFGLSFLIERYTNTEPLSI